MKTNKANNTILKAKMMSNVDFTRTKLTTNKTQNNKANNTILKAKMMSNADFTRTKLTTNKTTTKQNQRTKQSKTKNRW